MANLNELKKYHCIYKTTNLLNCKFYIGIHSTNNLNDGYLGSGKRLKRSIKKYGKENFNIEYLEFFDSRELLAEREKQLVNEDLLKDDNCMNLKTGGFGGGKFWSDAHKKKFTDAGLRNLKKGPLKVNELRLNSNWNDYFSKKVKEGLSKVNFNPSTFKGKSHTEETKQKMSEIKKGTGVGKTNSQFGTMWITNGTENKKIKKEERIPTGWKAGRII